MKNRIKHWDSMYELPLEKIPWEIENPPIELTELIDKSTISSGDALDIACGTGNYSFYLAKNGFQVTGVDFSEKALAIARTRNEDLKLPVSFIWADATNLKEVLNNKTFDFILDYSILHHIRPSLTKSYANQFKNMLKRGGKLLLVCYSDKDEFAEGKKVAKGKYGNTMYYRTRRQIEEAYKGLKEVYYTEAKLGKHLHHFGHCFLFERI